MTTLAVIPARYVWAAAQFAAKPSNHKNLIADVCLRVESDGAAYLYATNGHYAFRALVPMGPDDTASMEGQEFKFYASAFTTPGQLVKGGYLVFSAEGTATLEGVKGSDIRAWQPGDAGQYPNIRQLWPDDSALVCEPGCRMGASAKYLATIAKVADKLSSSGTVTFRTASAPSQPMVWTIDTELGEVEILLMPVQLRGEKATAEQESKRKRDHKRASDLKELLAYRSQTLAAQEAAK